MSSLYRKSRSPYWFIQHIDADGIHIYPAISSTACNNVRVLAKV